jgi:hypothetical protein
MSPRKRVFLLIAIMTGVSLVVEFIVFGMLYSIAFNEEEVRLTETVQSQARLIEAIARFGGQPVQERPSDAREATLRQVIDAHNHYRGFGQSGEFTLAEKQGDLMVYLLDHRHYDRGNPKPIPFDSKLGEPMRRALSGQSGTVVGLDYRGVRVLAAHEPVKDLNLGIVAKIDLAEIRAPFVRTGLFSALIGIIVIVAGAALFIMVTEPLLRRLQETVKELQNALNRVKTLSGLLPICASCKRIRDNKGDWNEVEVYVKSHTDADFTHGICPECVQKLYGDRYSPERAKRELHNETLQPTADRRD